MLPQACDACPSRESGASLRNSGLEAVEMAYARLLLFTIRQTNGRRESIHSYVCVRLVAHSTEYLAEQLNCNQSHARP